MHIVRFDYPMDRPAAVDPATVAPLARPADDAEAGTPPHWVIAFAVEMSSFGMFALMLFGGALGIL